MRGSIGGKVSKTNVIPFPLSARARKRAGDSGFSSGGGDYEFSGQELAALCRWFSAMKYAFPGTEGVMIVNHQESYSAVGLYNPAGGAPNCLIAETIIPWAAEWLFFFEGWLIDGHWAGGGTHPEPCRRS